MDSTICNIIEVNFPSYSNAESRVAYIVLNSPEKVIQMSIGKLSLEANVSDPTVVRFCRNLGFNGFKDFKIKLTQELAMNKPPVHSKVGYDDSTKSYIDKLGQYSIASLSKMIKQLDETIIDLFVESLSHANKVEFWGFGASAAVAHDAHHKFFRLGIPCSYSSDPHMQVMGASVLDENSLIVAISHTGRSKELIENIKVAKKSNAKVFAITSANSPLEKLCNYSIAIDLDENTDLFTPTVSRLAHLLIIDILVVGISLKKGDTLNYHFKAIKNALKEKKLR